MIQVPYQLPEKYVKCPSCLTKDVPVGHLSVGFKASWYCDACGAKFDLIVLGEGISTSIVPGERAEKTQVTLKSTGPMTILVEGRRYRGPSSVEPDDAYYYNEHTCPVNYLGVLKVVDGSGDDDPHGIFEWVKTEPRVVAAEESE